MKRKIRNNLDKDAEGGHGNNCLPMIAAVVTATIEAWIPSNGLLCVMTRNDNYKNDHREDDNRGHVLAWAHAG